jgi:hypothetical protein
MLAASWTIESEKDGLALYRTYPVEPLDRSVRRCVARAGRYGAYGSRVQQPWRIQVDAGGRAGTSDLLKQLVTMRLPVTTDQKVVSTTSCPLRARWESHARCLAGIHGQTQMLADLRCNGQRDVTIQFPS